MKAVLAFVFCMLVACSRPLTEAETTFASDLFGSSLETSKVRISLAAGLTPPPPPSKSYKVTEVVGTDKACVRVPQPLAIRQAPQALAYKNRMHFTGEIYSGDMALSWPERVRFPQLIILAHELTHVWQWQNRARTGYTPWRALRESWQWGDPYFSASGEAPEFFAFAYEQQAAIIEDYICFAAANPDHPRRAELRALLEPVLPVDHFDAQIRKRLR